MDFAHTAVASTPSLQIILGSTRQGRIGDQIANWFYQVVTTRDDVRAELLDLRDWPLPFFDQAVPPITGQYSPEAETWATKIREADGYVIVTPEYNWSYPAVLKNALDHIYKEWNTKPVAFVSYGGSAGGSRAVQHLRQVVAELQMVPLRDSIMLPFAHRLFDQDGTLTDPAYEARANALLDQWVTWAEALRGMRMGAAGVV
jgi:NAD(P)H-dependent FMN reductase